MGRAVVIKNSFNAGEISPYTLARTDIAKYKDACERLENWIPLITGGITRRPGTRYIVPALGPSRLIQFEYSTSQTFILELGNQEIRFFTKDPVAGPGIILDPSTGNPYTIASPYDTSSDNLWDIKYVQQGDVMYLTHPNYPVMKLSRLTDTDWRLTTPNFQSPPTNAFDQDVSGAATAGVAIVSITHVSTSVFQITLAAPSGAAIGDSIAVAGSSNPYYNGTWTVLNVTESGTLHQVGVSNIGPLGLTSYGGTFYDPASSAGSGPITLTPGATGGNGVTFTASATVFIAGDVGKYIVSGAGLALILSLAGSTTVDPDTGATLYPQAVCNIVDMFASTAAIAAGAWKLRGSPSGYLEFCIKSSSDVHLARNYGKGQTVQAYVFADYAADGVAFPATVDCFREIDVGRYLIAGGAVGVIQSLSTGAASNAAGHATVYLFSPVEDTVTASANADVVAAPQSAGVWSVEDAAFGPVNGYPNACTFMQDRLLLAGTAAQPLQVWGSRTGDYENFAKGPGDADGLDFGVNAAMQQPIRALQEFRGNLGVFTARDEYMVGGGIVTIQAGGSQALTPSNVTAVRQSKYGTARVQPQIIQNMLLYLWRSKMAMAEMSYNIYQANFGSRNLNVLHELITTSGIKEMTWQEFPFYAIWFTTEDNQLIGLTYEVEQQVWGWHRHFTGQDMPSGSLFADQFISVCAVQDPTDEENDNLWAVTRRLIGSVETYAIEFFDPTLNTDAALQKTFGAETTEVSGLTYLYDRTVQIKADGAYLGEFVVPATGIVNFQAQLPEGGLDIEVGLPYISVALTVRPEIGGNGQTVQGLKKTWQKVFARVYNAVNLIVGAGPAAENQGGVDSGTGAGPWRLLGRKATDPMTGPVAPFTGDVPLPGNLGSDFDGRVLVEQDQPFACTVLAPFGILTIGDQ